MNHIKISGRVVADPTINENNTRVSFRIIHNFGGETEPLALNLVALKNKKGLPYGVEGLKKGDNVIVTAFMRPANYTAEVKDKDGNVTEEMRYYNQLLVKSVKANTEKESVNDFTLSGRLAADPKTGEKSSSFILIHNFGDKAGNIAALSMRYVAFAGKDGKFAAGVDTLKKGKAVEVSAFMRPSTFEKDGKNVTVINYIVKKVTDWAPAKADDTDGDDAEGSDVIELENA